MVDASETDMDLDSEHGASGGETASASGNRSDGTAQSSANTMVEDVRQIGQQSVPLEQVSRLVRSDSAARLPSRLAALCDRDLILQRPEWLRVVFHRSTDHPTWVVGHGFRECAGLAGARLTVDWDIFRRVMTSVERIKTFFEYLEEVLAHVNPRKVGCAYCRRLAYDEACAVLKLDIVAGKATKDTWEYLMDFL